MPVRSQIASAAKAGLKAPIHLYRWTLKPFVGWQCRHQPTCSEYALTAIETNGAWRGFWLMISRLARCHPWGTHGYDPAPDVRGMSAPLTPWRYGRWTWSGELGLDGTCCDDADAGYQEPTQGRSD